MAGPQVQEREPTPEELADYHAKVDAAQSKLNRAYEGEQETEVGFDQWVILELMGHRRLAGRLTEQHIAGATFLRLDTPKANGQPVTQFYRPESVYCITPTTEEIATVIAAGSRPAPVSRFELPAGSDTGHVDQGW